MVKFQAHADKFGHVTAAIQGPEVTPEISVYIQRLVNEAPTPETVVLVNEAACFVTVTPDAVAGCRIELELWGRKPQPLLNFINEQLDRKAYLPVDIDQVIAA